MRRADLFGANFRSASSCSTDTPSANFYNAILRNSLFHSAIFGSTFYLGTTTAFTII
jgi:uncharacterized protein YjbI with pentapeptide repeats